MSASRHFTPRGMGRKKQKWKKEEKMSFFQLFSLSFFPSRQPKKAGSSMTFLGAFAPFFRFLARRPAFLFGLFKSLFSLLLPFKREEKKWNSFAVHKTVLRNHKYCTTFAAKHEITNQPENYSVFLACGRKFLLDFCGRRRRNQSLN